MTTPVDKTLTVKSAVDKICNSNQNHMLINNNTQRFKYIFCDFNADIKYSDDMIHNVMTDVSVSISVVLLTYISVSISVVLFTDISVSISVVLLTDISLSVSVVLFTDISVSVSVVFFILKYQ
jgi:hypothetical protein